MRIPSLLPLVGLAGVLLTRSSGAPTEHHYQVRYWSAQVLDFAPIGQPVQRLGFGYNVWMRARLSDTLPDLSRLVIAVDSARLTQGSQVPLPIDSLGGAEWRGLLRADGRLAEWNPKPSIDRPGAAHFRTILWQFYPRLTDSLAIGASWTDSVTQAFAEINGKVTFASATTYRVEGIDTIMGQPTWRVAGDIRWGQTAELQFLRGMGSMNGAGTGRGVYYVALGDRSYLGGEQTIVSDLQLARPGLNPVPIHDSVTTSVILLP